MNLVKQWRYVLLAMLAIVALGVMAACGDDGDDAKPSPPPAATIGASDAPSDMAPDAEQVLRIDIGAEPGTIDPQAMAYTHEATIVQNSFIPLFDQDPETSQLTPLAAAEVPTTANGGVSADGLTHTIKLKSDLKWSDGSALTAADFVYGIIRGYDLTVSGAGYGGFIAGIKGAPEALELDSTSATYVADVNAILAPNVVAVDDTTLKIVAAKPSVSFMSNFILPITAAVKQTNVEALGESFGQSAGAPEMITSGPFTITEWVPADHVTLARNENYTADHKAYLREVEVNFITDSGQAFSAATGANPSLDQASVPGSQYASVKDDPTIYQEQEFGTRFIWVDSTIPPWDKKEFVTAINQATDRETISRDIYFGLRQAWVPLCAAAVYACDPSIFETMKFDLDKAKASALVAYPDGIIPGIILEGIADPVVQNLLVTLQSQWQEIPGVTVELRTVDQATLQSDMKTHISGTQISGWGMDFADPSNLWKLFHSDAIGGNNLGFYERPAFDTLMEQQDAQFDPTERRATLEEIQQLLASDPPAITLLVSLRTNYYNEKVKGIVASPFDYQIVGDQFLEDIYIGTE